jgi:Pentose-5-phosphate-3-epimerase
MKKKISVTFLTCKKIDKALKLIDLTDADFIHVDHMDGRFVSKRFKPLRTLKKISNTLNKRLDVHIMAKKPLKLIREYAYLNTEYITIHVELEKDLEKCINEIKNFGIKCGLAINPNTDISKLEPLLEKIDLILVMSVEPGKGGQTFIDDTIDKIIDIKNIIKERNLNIQLSVDGGINNENLKKLKSVDIACVGSFITNSEDWQKAIDTLR